MDTFQDRIFWVSRHLLHVCLQLSSDWTSRGHLSPCLLFRQTDDISSNTFTHTSPDLLCCLCITTSLVFTSSPQLLRCWFSSMSHPFPAIYNLLSSALFAGLSSLLFPPFWKSPFFPALQQSPNNFSFYPFPCTTSASSLTSYLSNSVLLTFKGDLTTKTVIWIYKSKLIICLLENFIVLFFP